jgi:excisionase family DNA binding protein
MSTKSEEANWYNDLMTVREVADYFRVSRVTVWRWCQDGVIPAFRIGRTWRIRYDDLVDLEDCLKNDNNHTSADEPILEHLPD